MANFEEMMEELHGKLSSKETSKKKKKKTDKESKVWNAVSRAISNKDKEIAPVIGGSSISNSVEKEERKIDSKSSKDHGGSSTGFDEKSISRRQREKEREQEDKKDLFGFDLFQKGALSNIDIGKRFEDGYQFGDVIKTSHDLNTNVAKAILGTAGDAGVNFMKGAGNYVEGMTDALGYFDAEYRRLLGNERGYESIINRTEKQSVEDFFAQADKKVENWSVLGETSDEAFSGLGQVGAEIGIGFLLSQAGINPKVVTKALQGLSAFGNGVTEARADGASDADAYHYGLLAAAAEVISESLFDSLSSFAKAANVDAGILDADKYINKAVNKLIKSKTWRNVAKGFLRGAGEGIEEGISGLLQAGAKAVTYLRDEVDSVEDFIEIVKDENILEQMFVGLLTGEMVQVADVSKANKAGRDVITGLNEDEQKVVDKLVDEEVAKAEKEGKKAKRGDIEETIVEKLEKGGISTDDIERVLGGEEYESYIKGRDSVMAKDDYKSWNETYKEEETLRNKYGSFEEVANDQYRSEFSSRLEELKARRAELRQKLQPDFDRVNNLSKTLRENVSNRVKDGYLAESYRELVRSTEKFKADVSKYKSEAAKKTIQNFIDGGIANNTNEFHEFADFMAKIADDKGIVFNVTDNNNLKGTRFEVKGAQVNAFVDEDGNVTINKDSKKRLNSLVGHEVTHVLKNTEFYGVLEEAVKSYAQAKGEWDSRLKAVTDLYNKYKPDANPTEEVVADLIGDYIFTDKDFVMNLSTKHRNLFEWLHDNIKHLAKLATAGSKEARELERVKKVFEDVWRNTSNTLTGNDSTYDTGANVPDGKPTQQQDVEFSLSEDTKLADKAAEFNQKDMFVGDNILSVAKELRAQVAAELREMKDNGVAIPEDIKGNTAIANSSYDVTEENTTICPRSLAAEAFVDAVSEYLGRPLTIDEQIYVSQDLQGRMLTPECTYCYVATDRKAYRAFLGEYIKQRDSVLEKLKANPNADVSRSGDLYKEFLGGRKDTNPMYSRFKMWVDAYNSGAPIIEASHLANIDKLMGDINSEFGEELYPQIKDAMKYAQSASWAKKRVSYVAYDGHILKWKADRIKKLNSHYGLRMYSFSDFHPAFVLENMQMITDAAVRGLKVLGYTKDTDFVEIFAPTGMNINISTFGFESGGNVYENNMIGANWQKAQELRSQHPNVGITFVATSDSQVEWALDQDWIDVVIPYHLVRTGEAVANAFGFNNYTKESSDTKAEDWTKGKDKKYIAPTEHNNDKATYLAALEKNHLKPRFERFLDNPNYMKLVNECRQSATETQAVQPVFGEEAISRVLAKLKADGYYQPVGGSVDRMYEIAAQVAENMPGDLQSVDTSKAGWVKDLPIRHSISENDEAQRSNIGYGVYGNNIGIRNSLDPFADIAPIGENVIPSVASNNANVAYSISEEDRAFQPPAERVYYEPEGAIPGTFELGPVAEQTFAPPTAVTEGFTPVAQTPTEEKTAQILTESPVVERDKMNVLHKAEELFVDKGAVFEKLAKKAKNRELEAKYNAMHYSNGNAQTFIGEGDPNANVASLVDVSKQVGNRDHDFFTYMYHLHNMDRMTLDRRGFGENKAVYGENVSAEMSSAIAQQIERQNPDFRDLAVKVYGINQYLRQMMVNGGLISQETADLWAKMYPHYVPIGRADYEALAVTVPLDSYKTGVNAPVKRAVGGNSDISPMFDTMAKRIMQTFKAIDRNDFGVELMNTLHSAFEQSAANIDEVIDGIDVNDELLQDGKNGRAPTFTVFQNGERVKFAITKEMYDAMKPTSDELAYTSPLANGFGNFRRGLITEYNPSFLLTNAIKDAQDVLFNSQHAVETYKAFPRAAEEIRKNGAYYQEYMRNGGGENTYFDRVDNKFVKDKSTIRKVVGFPIDMISAANNFIERIPRLAEYIASREAGRSIKVSMLDAARVTTNFAAGGDVTKFLNRNGFTFLNASVQGARQVVRNVQEARMQGFKGWLKLAGKTILAGLPAVLLNGLIWRDDEEYEELSDYVKENYYIIGKFGDGKFVRIPKGRTMAVVQEGLRQMQDFITGDDETDFDKFLQLVLNNLAPNNPLDNNIISPFVQAWTNKAWHGGEIVPESLQDVPEAEQYDESTDSISKWLGERINVSPMKINYVLDQLSGGLGDTFLPMLTAEAESGTDSKLGKLFAPLADKFTTDSVFNNQNSADFYELKDKLAISANSFNATDDDILKSKYMNSVSAELRDLYKEKREIQNSRKYSDSEKYEMARDIQREINERMRSAIESYEDISYEQDAKTGVTYAEVDGKYFKLDDEGHKYEWSVLNEEQTAKYKITSAAGDANYATDGETHFRWVDKSDETDEKPHWEKITDKQLAKQNYISEKLGITPDEYWSNQDDESKKMYNWAYENPEKLTVSKAVTDDFKEYWEYKNYIDELDSKDAQGNTVNGLKKQRVFDYIESLPLDAGEKMILFKTYYKTTDTYNYQIVEYLNGRDDISYREMKEILIELGATIGADGKTITWD